MKYDTGMPQDTFMPDIEEDTMSFPELPEKIDVWSLTRNEFADRDIPRANYGVLIRMEEKINALIDWAKAMQNKLNEKGE